MVKFTDTRKKITINDVNCGHFFLTQDGSYLYLKLRDGVVFIGTPKDKHLSGKGIIEIYPNPKANVIDAQIDIIVSNPTE